MQDRIFSIPDNFGKTVNITDKSFVLTNGQGNEVEYQVLNDVNERGKEVNWRSYKVRSLRLADSYYRLDMDSKATRVLSCSPYLVYRISPDGSRKLKNMISCRVRLCAMCAWRRSKKIFGQVSTVMNHLCEHHDYEYIFGTFSIKNVCAADLSLTLDLMFKSFNNMTQRVGFKKLSNGWFRALEVTYNGDEYITHDMWHGNKESHKKPMRDYFKKLGLSIGDKNPNYDTYHPHFHVIIAVDKSYFKNKSVYLSHSKWVELWQSCLRVDYLPVVDLRPFRDSARGKGVEVAEVAKYSVKASDIFPHFPDNVDPKSELGQKIQAVMDAKSDELVLTFDSALRGRRLIAFGGKFKEVHKMLNLDDPEDGDLVHTDNDDDLREDLHYIFVRYNWNFGVTNYVFSGVVDI